MWQIVTTPILKVKERLVEKGKNARSEIVEMFDYRKNSTLFQSLRNRKLKLLPYPYNSEFLVWRYCLQR